MGNLKANLQVKTETAILKMKEQEEKERKAASVEIEARCHASAEKGKDHVTIECLIKLEETVIEIPTIIRFAKDNQLLVIEVKSKSEAENEEIKTAVTLSWNTSLVNRIKNIWFTLLNN